MARAKPIYVVVQKTDKRYKATMLIANCIQVFGILAMLGGEVGGGFCVMVFGIIMHIYGRAGQWWNNN